MKSYSTAKRYATNLALAALATLSASVGWGATVGLRVGSEESILDQYRNFPASYQTNKAMTDYLHYDLPVTTAKRDLFFSTQALIALGYYGAGDGTGYNGNEVVSKIRAYENAGMTVAAIFVYREDWLAAYGGPGGPYTVDRRLISNPDIANIRNAIATASPPLICKATVKIIQLLGGRVQGERGDSWLRMSDAHKARLATNFDGVGIECHIGDNVTATPGDDHQSTLRAMAEVAAWAGPRGKQAFVFMGGLAPIYENFSRCQATYRYLWSQMTNVGVEKKAAHLIYFRQGAWPGKHTPESADDTLTRQQKWVINSVK